MSARSTRRQAIAGGALATAAALVPAGVAEAKPDQRQISAQLLANALGVELAAVVAYEAIANSGRVSQRATAIFRQLLDQERAHVEALTKAVEDLDGTPPQSPRRADIPGLAGVQSDKSAVRFAIALEDRTLRAFSAAILELADANAIRIVSTIVGAEGGHLVLLRLLGGERALDGAFETGTP
jgi:rubrerythrin